MKPLKPTPMLRIECRPVVPGAVRLMKLTLVRPPFTEVGAELTFLGTRWIVTKVSRAKGILLPCPKNSIRADGVATQDGMAQTKQDEG